MDKIKIYREDINNEMLWTVLCRVSGADPSLNNRLILTVKLESVEYDLDFRDEEL